MKIELLRFDIKGEKQKISCITFDKEGVNHYVFIDHNKDNFCFGVKEVDSYLDFMSIGECKDLINHLYQTGKIDRTVKMTYSKKGYTERN